MAKVAGGFLMGFGLATAIFFFIIFAILSPYSSQITTLYQTTQSAWFGGAISFLGSIGSLTDNWLVNLLTGGIGGTIAGWAGDISDFMLQTKQTISILYTLMTITVPAIIVAIIMLFVGIFVASRPKGSTHKPIIREVEKSTEEGKKCEKCGEELSDEDKFCPGCGEKVE